MTKQFRVDRSLRDSATVDGNVLSMLTQAILMDDLREILLTHTTFSRDEHRQIGRSHLQGDINGPIQTGMITDDAKTLFDELYVRFHNLHPLGLIGSFI